MSETGWTANSPSTHPVYQQDCIIRTRGGEELKAKLIHLNEQYYTRVKDKDVWTVKNHKSVPDKDVVEWKYAGEEQ